MSRPDPIATTADIERVEAMPYAQFMPHTSVYNALCASAHCHAGRPALRFIASPDPDALPAAARSWT